jgi:hypothetical protein
VSKFPFKQASLKTFFSDAKKGAIACGQPTALGLSPPAQEDAPDPERPKGYQAGS